MELVKSEFENDKLTVFLSGHIDSANSAEVETAILDEIAKQPGAPVTVDLADLEYISSAGLRIILRLRKSTENLALINASPEVYEIFETTGFTEIVKIEKAYKRLSVEGCEVIGQGANGKVFRIDRDTVVKQYRYPDSLPEIQRERDLAKKAFIMGIPTAIPYDIVRIDDGYGSVFELLNATSFAKILIADPSKFDEVVERSVALLKKIHSIELAPGDMPDARAEAIERANRIKGFIDDDVSEKLITAIESIPVDHHMIHGDYHIKNVMLQEGEEILIDMDTLCLGHPIFELAQVYNAYLGFSELDHNNVKEFLGIDYEISKKFWKRTLELYFDTTDEARLTDLEEKIRIVAYARMLARAFKRKLHEVGIGKDLAELQVKEITELLGRHRDLSF